MWTDALTFVLVPRSGVAIPPSDACVHSGQEGTVRLLIGWEGAGTSSSAVLGMVMLQMRLLGLFEAELCNE